MTKRQKSSTAFILLSLLLLVGTVFFSKQLEQAPVQQIIKALEDAGMVAHFETNSVVESERATSSAQLGVPEYAVVTKIIDGDTIQIDTGQKVRYIGVNTPETHHPQKGQECFGLQASEANKKLVEGKKVRLEKDISDTDRYGRLLRYVWVEDTLVNESLVRNGFAYASSYPPDIHKQELFRAAENQARTDNIGLWKDCLL